MDGHATAAAELDGQYHPEPFPPLSTDLQTKSTVLHSFQGIEKRHLWLDSAVNASSRSTGSAGQSTVLQYFQGVKARHLWLDSAVNASSRSLEPQMNIP